MVAVVTLTAPPLSSAPVKVERAVWSVGLPLHQRACNVNVPRAANRDGESAEIVHDKSVEGIDSARERHANARGLFEDLIVSTRCFSGRCILACR